MSKNIVINPLLTVMLFAVSTASWCDMEPFSYCQVGLKGINLHQTGKLHQTIRFDVKAYTYTQCDEAIVDITVEGGLRVVEGETHWQGKLDYTWHTRPLTLQIEEHGVHTITAKLVARKLHLLKNPNIKDVETCSSSDTLYIYTRRDAETGEDTLIASSFKHHLDEVIENWDTLQVLYRRDKVISYRNKYQHDPDSFRIMSRHYMYTKEQMRLIEQYKLLDSIPGKSFLESCVNNPIHQNKFSGGTDEQKANNTEAALRQFETLYEYDSKIIFEPSIRDSLLQNRQRLLNRLIFVPKEAIPKEK